MDEAAIEEVADLVLGEVVDHGDVEPFAEVRWLDGGGADVGWGWAFEDADFESAEFAELPVESAGFDAVGHEESVVVVIEGIDVDPSGHADGLVDAADGKVEAIEWLFEGECAFAGPATVVEAAADDDAIGGDA